MHPISNFPLLESDQAEVIRIYLELMCAGERAGHTPEAKTSQPVAPRNDSNDAWPLEEPSDLA